MGFASGERRVYSWWLILVGFAFGVFVTLIVTHPSIVADSPPLSSDALALTATRIVGDATLSAQQGVQFSDTDPIFATATAIVQQATRDAFIQTATDFAHDATAAAR